jgi:N-acetylglucosamine kinase-like BadF-type ATPase
MSGRSRRPAVLAVDGGGSKIDAALLRKDGTVLGAARIRTEDFEENGGPHHMRQVLDAVTGACRDAGLDAVYPIAELGVYCLAGADLPADDRKIVRWLRAESPTKENIVRNDTFAVLRAGTERHWGVGVVCGSGTNCSAVAPDGRITRFPAVGTISGDWGGGADVGEAALWYAIRAEDGRGTKSALAAAVPTHFGLRRPRQVLEALYYGRLDEERLVELAPLVFHEASRGDVVARTIVDRQADEVVAMATTAIKRLRMQKLDVDVVLGGGIFRNDDEAFFERIGDGVHEVAPGARFTVLTDPPVIGAAWLGLDRLEASRSSYARVHRALTHARLSTETPIRRKERH